MAVMLREASPRQLAAVAGRASVASSSARSPSPVAAMMVVVLGLLTGLLNISNPFATQTIDRTPPAVLRRLESLSSYRGASANFEVNVDLEKRHRFVPTFLAGERTVFLAVGSVDAVVDFDGIDATRVVQSDGGERVVVTLPHARTLRAVVDTDQSHVSSETAASPTVSVRFHRQPDERAAAVPPGREEDGQGRDRERRDDPGRTQHHEDARRPARQARVRGSDVLRRHAHRRRARRPARRRPSPPNTIADVGPPTVPDLGRAANRGSRPQENRGGTRLNIGEPARFARILTLRVSDLDLPEACSRTCREIPMLLEVFRNRVATSTPTRMSFPDARTRPCLVFPAVRRRHRDRRGALGRGRGRMRVVAPHRRGEHAAQPGEPAARRRGAPRCTGAPRSVAPRTATRTTRPRTSPCPTRGRRPRHGRPRRERRLQRLDALAENVA